MTDLERIVAHCKGGVHVEANGHRTNYETVAAYFNADRRPLTDIADLAEWQGDVAQRCIEHDCVWEVQAYPDTPIGFHLTIGASLLEAVQAMLEVLGLVEDAK